MNTIAIIGSGMGGLVAGNFLAKKGHKVTIFESFPSEKEAHMSSIHATKPRILA